MCFSLFRTRFFISYYFIIFIGLMLVCDKTALLIPVMCAVAVHETGHICAIKYCGFKLKSIEVYPFLLRAKYDCDFTFFNMLTVYICGPLFNLILGAILLTLYNIFNNQTLFNLAAISFLVGAYNLMPCAGLDGGSITKLILLKIFSQKTAKILLIIISCVFTVATIWFVLYMLNFKINATVLCLAFYLFISTFFTEVKNIGR